ncbi:hypothetical protein [Streptomyces sp. NPDC049970]
MLIGSVVGALVALLATRTVRRKKSSLATRLKEGPLLTAAPPDSV